MAYAIKEKIYFFDTNVLLSQLDFVREQDEFLLSSVSLKELEGIKTSGTKSEEARYEARQAVRFLDENPGKYKVIVWDINSACDFLEYGLEDSPDNRIIRCAEYARDVMGYSGLVFCSNDLLARLIAKEYYHLPVEIADNSDKETYTGFVTKQLSDDEIEYLYNYPENNIYDLLINQYLLITDYKGEVVDTLRWTGNGYDTLNKKVLKSLSFGDKLKPKDIYQQMAIDSILKNQLTIISGKAGSGKSLISLMSAMYLVDSGKYDRLVVLYNPVKVRGSESQGYYPGTSNEKAMQSGIGQILITKFGDRFGVDLLISQDKLKLVCMSDCRGMEIKNEVLWISEGENTSIDLIKICLSRVSSEAKVIIEGDYEQIDNVSFQGSKNGMKRAIDVLKGQPEFGYVELQNVWRSRIAELCDLL